MTKLVEVGNQDQVTIQIDSYLKGNAPDKVLTFTLVTHGGLKDFDPKLKPGDSGVFFLNMEKREGHADKAYCGSIAIFPKNHFDLTEKKEES